MKYMTFRASCSYAGVANLLEARGVEAEDREIALGMKLPYLFAYEDGVYLAGPMLQSAAWFNLYLNPLGFEMVETAVPAARVPLVLQGVDTAMLGLQVRVGEKHAVVYTGMEEGKLRLRNNKRRDDPAPEELLLTPEELTDRLDGTVMVAVLKRIDPRQAELGAKIAESAAVLERNFREIREICCREETVGALRGKLNSLFRPLLLDGITMLELLGERELAARFAAIQHRFLTALGREGTQVIRLAEELPMEEFACAVEAYLKLLREA